VAGLKCFLPGSQIDIKPITDYDAFVGTTIKVVVLNINYAKSNIVVSHRALIEQELEHQRKHVMDTLEEGQIGEGTVRNITNFGVFLDLGGVAGLIYIKNIN
jgi:small subunit ribosomal protein S1